MKTGLAICAVSCAHTAYVAGLAFWLGGWGLIPALAPFFGFVIWACHEEGMP